METSPKNMMITGADHNRARERRDVDQIAEEFYRLCHEAGGTQPGDKRFGSRELALAAKNMRRATTMFGQHKKG